MTEEIDFLQEAKNIETFRAYLSGAGLESICTAPYVYRQLSTQRCVCVTGLLRQCQGVTISDSLRLQDAGCW